MAKHVHETFSCDRCGADLGDKPPVRAQAMRVSWSANYAEGPGPSGSWADLCDGCYAACRAFFLPGEPSIANKSGYGLHFMRKLCERSMADGAAVRQLDRAALCVGYGKELKGG